MAARRRTVLCVDDEPNVLEGLALTLRRTYRVLTATSGFSALATLEQTKDICVVLSDMRMPAMNGAGFLTRVRTVAPDAVRMILTGQTELESAIAAVNEGQIFRFLTKPCPPPTLLAAMDAAVAQHDLLTAEKVLLEHTLHGCIRTLTDVLSLTSPAAFGRAERLRSLVHDLLTTLAVEPQWPVEVAAMLSPLGCLALPPETLEKTYFGRPLTEHEQALVARVPSVTDQLLSHIPRLDVVRDILSLHTRPAAHGDRDGDEPLVRRTHRYARILRVAVDFDALEASGMDAHLAIDVLHGRTPAYDEEVLTALELVRAPEHTRADVRELPFGALQPGMILATDLLMSSGTLLAARGFVITASFVSRMANMREGNVRVPIRVVVPPARDEIAAA